MIMLTMLAILALCLDNLKQYQTVGDKIFDQVINELILVLRGDSVSKNLPRLNNFFISHNKNRNLSKIHLQRETGTLKQTSKLEKGRNQSNNNLKAEQRTKEQSMNKEKTNWK